MADGNAVALAVGSAAVLAVGVAVVLAVVRVEDEVKLVLAGPHQTAARRLRMKTRTRNATLRKKLLRKKLLRKRLLRKRPRRKRTASKRNCKTPPFPRTARAAAIAGSTSLDWASGNAFQ